ncbi:MAG: uroporphyrinogen decarboxylase family protein [Armatimonadota bacterium]
MDSRERTLTAIEHRTPDRIPIDFWASKGFLRKLNSALGLSLEEFTDAWGVDIGYIRGPEYIGPPLDTGPAGQTDVWGVPRVVSVVSVAGGSEAYEEVTAPPLAGAQTAEDVLNYLHWPSADWFDYSAVPGQCEQVLRRKRAVAFMGDRLNRVAQLKPAMYLRGVEAILVDMAVNPELAEAIFRRISEFYLAYLERTLEAARGRVDIVVTGDDFGTQQGLLVSASMWDQYLRDGFARYLSLAKNSGAKTMHHTCGAVAELIPRMIGCGLDVLQSLQPEARGMKPAELKQRHGEQLAFQGGVSVQRTMPFGRRAEIRAEVRELAEAMGKGGGYIFCTSHNIQADTPVENAQELMRAYLDFGRYEGP